MNDMKEDKDWSPTNYYLFLL